MQDRDNFEVDWVEDPTPTNSALRFYVDHVGSSPEPGPVDLAYATEGDLVVACREIRWGSRSSWSNLQAENFGLGSFRSVVSDDKIATFGPSVVADTTLDSKDVIEFAVEARATRYAFDADVEVICLASTPDEVPFHRLLGWRPYRPVVPDEVFETWVPLVAVTSDVDYFDRIGSPLGVLAKRKEIRSDAAQEILRLIHHAGPGQRPAAPTQPDAMDLDAAFRQRAVANTTRRLSEAAIGELTRLGTVLEFEAGAQIVTAGSSDRDLYFVLDGLVETYDGDRFVGPTTKGEFFGEVAFFTNMPRMNSVVTGPHGALVLVIDPEALDRHIASQDPNVTRLLHHLANDLATKLLQRQHGLIFPKPQ